MSQQLEPRGGWRCYRTTRNAGFLLLASLLLSPLGSAPTAAAGSRVFEASPPLALVSPGPRQAVTCLAWDSFENVGSRRESALRGAALRAPGPRISAHRHPSETGAPDQLAGREFRLDAHLHPVALSVTAGWCTAEGISHADGIRGPPESRAAARSKSSTS